MFDVKVMKLMVSVNVAGVPVDFFTSDKFEILLMSDPRFVSLKDKCNPKFQPTIVPLTNVAYLSIAELPKENKKGK